MKNEGVFIERLREIFVSLERYNLEVPPLKNLIYGGLGMIIVAVFAAWISLVVKVQ